MNKEKFIEMLDAYDSLCDKGKTKAYKNGQVNVHIHWKGRGDAAKDFRQMMLDGEFDIVKSLDSTESV